MKKQPRRYFLIFNKDTSRSLAVVEADSRGEATERAKLVAHLMNRPPENSDLLDATRIKHSGAPIGLPTFFTGFFQSLQEQMKLATAAA